MHNSIKLRWYSDAGHSWLQVRRKDADMLGILDLVSNYSYQSPKGKTIYLEEDSDAPRLLQACKDQEVLTHYSIDRHTNGTSPIRRLPAYNHQYRTYVVSRGDSDLIQRLNQTERFIRERINPDYEIPRSSDQYPWGIDDYYTVLDNAREYVRERFTHLCCVIDPKTRDVIATNDPRRLQALSATTINALK